ncbi:MAG: hypothetical protein C0406_09845 [Sideroxydans sp.]|nr:hypothetical protein [Sideroxydans sp.]
MGLILRLRTSHSKTCEMPKKITAVIPAYDLQDVIGIALRSVLSQTSLPDEVIVVDDGSTDSTAKVVSQISAEAPVGFIRYVYQVHAGAGAARNRGVRDASGEWIAFLDGDDLWLPPKIAQLRRAIVEHPEASIISHDEFEIGLDGKEFLKPLHQFFNPKAQLLTQLYRRSFLSTSCVSVKRDAIVNVGGFDESLLSAQDYELWLKLACQEKLAFVPEALAKYVLRPNSITANVQERYRCSLVIARRYAQHLVPLIGLRAALCQYLFKVLACHWIAIHDFGAQGKLVSMFSILGRLPQEMMGVLILLIGRLA